MNEENHTLPDDVKALKRIIHQRDQELERSSLSIQKYQQKYEELESQYQSLDQKFKYLQKLFFGKKSEKLTPEEVLQGRLFNEAESSGKVLDDNNESEKIEIAKEAGGDNDVTIVIQHTRSKAGRKPIPANIPRKEIIHDLSDEEKKCACCGNNRPLIGTDETEELEYIPAKIFALKHIYPKYGP